MTDAVLSVRNLRVYYGTRRGSVRAVDGVSLETRPAITSQRNGGAESSAVATPMGPATEAMGTD